MRDLREDYFYKAVAGSLAFHLGFLLLLKGICPSYQSVTSSPNLLEVVPLRLQSSPQPKAPPLPLERPPISRDVGQNEEARPFPQERALLAHPIVPSKDKAYRPGRILKNPLSLPPQKGTGETPNPPPHPGSAYRRQTTHLPSGPLKAIGNPSPSNQRPTTPGGPLPLGSTSARGEDLGFVEGTTSPGVPPNVEGQGTGSGPGEGPGQAKGPQPIVRPPSELMGEPAAGERSGSKDSSSAGKAGLNAKGRGNGEKLSSEDNSPIAHQNRLADRKEPELVYFVSPSYPLEALEDEAEGSVTLEYLINEQGEVKNIRIVKSSGDSRLDRSAMDAVRKWRYLPAVQDGIPREVKRRRTIEFRLPR